MWQIHFHFSSLRLKFEVFDVAMNSATLPANLAIVHELPVAATHGLSEVTDGAVWPSGSGQASVKVERLHADTDISDLLGNPQGMPHTALEIGHPSPS